MGTMDWTIEDYPEDIHEKIRRDFPATAQEARQLISEHIATEPTSERVLRCVLFKAEGRLPELRHYLQLTAVDNRDLIREAEYERPLLMNRIHDFDKPFTWPS